MTSIGQSEHINDAGQEAQIVLPIVERTGAIHGAVPAEFAAGQHVGPELIIQGKRFTDHLVVRLVAGGVFTHDTVFCR